MRDDSSGRGVVRARRSATIGAPPKTIYAILADYEVSHPTILPAAFRDYSVERGGRGAGTVIRFAVKMGPTTSRARAEVFEPEPGRVLEERSLGRPAVTRFVVDPDPRGSRVTITTEWPATGLRAWVERRIAVPFLEKLYADELANLDRLARARANAAAAE